jgi:Mrp family chromosome partitioning ATPase
VAGLCLLPRGAMPLNPSEILAGKPFASLLRPLLDIFDRIIIDSSPVMLANEARVIAASVDATLLVLRMDQSTHRDALNAVEELGKVGAHVLGVIAGDMPLQRESNIYRGSSQYELSGKRELVRIVSQPVAQQSSDSTMLGSLDIAEPNWSEPAGSSDNQNGRHW